MEHAGPGGRQGHLLLAHQGLGLECVGARAQQGGEVGLAEGKGFFCQLERVGVQGQALLRLLPLAFRGFQVAAGQGAQREEGIGGVRIGRLGRPGRRQRGDRVPLR